MYNVCERDVNY